MAYTQDQLQQLLDEALDARHRLLIGKQAVELMQDGRRVRYGDATASLQRLDRYIASLQAQLANVAPRRGRVFYGVPA